MLTERQVEEAIWRSGGKMLDWAVIWDRQVDTGCGVADLIGIQIDGDHLTFKVTEIKKGVVDPGAVGQLLRYVAALADSNVMDELIRTGRVQVAGVLIGSSIEPAAVLLIRSLGWEYWSWSINGQMTRHDLNEINALEDHSPARWQQFQSDLSRTVHASAKGHHLESTEIVSFDHRKLKGDPTWLHRFYENRYKTRASR